MRWRILGVVIIYGLQVGGASGPPTVRGQTEHPQRSLEILIELAWLGDPITFPYFLEARADKTHLEVRGYVPSRAVREHALGIARLHSPLTTVDKLREHSSLAVKVTRLPTPLMQTSAQSALREAFPLSYQLLEVQADHDGTVTIRGAVRTIEEKLAVSQALRRLHGCVAVHNLVEVAPEGKRTVKSPVRPPAKAGESRSNPVVPASRVDAPTTAETWSVKPRAADKKALPGAADVSLAARIKKQVQQACPGASEIQVQVQSSRKMRIDLHVRDEKELGEAPDRIFAIPDLQAYEIDLRIMAPPK